MWWRFGAGGSESTPRPQSSSLLTPTLAAAGDSGAQPGGAGTQQATAAPEPTEQHGPEPTQQDSLGRAGDGDGSTEEV